MKKTSKISLFLFIFFYNYLWLRILIFPMLYNKFGTTGFVMFLLIILGVIGLFLVLPNKIFKNNFIQQYNKSWYKWINLLFVSIEAILSLCFVVYFFNKVFIEESNIYILSIVLGLAIIFVSNLLPNEIVDISTLFHIGGLGLIFLSLLFTPKLEIDYLFIVNNINVKYILLTAVFIVFDNLKLLINKDSLEINKKKFILPITLSLALCIIEYGMLIMTVGDKALLNISYIGFLELSFMPVTKYLGDFNFVYIYLLLICCIFKNGFNLSIIKKSIVLNKNITDLILVITLFFCSILLLNCIEITGLYLYLFLVILANLTIIWMIGKCYFVRKG